MLPTSRTRCAALLAALLLTGARPLFAQIAPSSSAAAPAEKAPVPPDAASEPVMLSPFEVRTEKDTGYQAASTLAGGRIATALDRTPAAVSVLTREFLDDIGADNFTDAAKWSVNTFLVAPTSDFSDYRVDFRSTGQAGNGTVNYFVFSETMDSYSTDRLEFSRGPNAILFGEGNLSGIWTVYLKQPRFRDFSQGQAKIESNGNRRETLDVNRQFWRGKAALRLALLDQKGDYYRQPSRNDRQGAFLSGVVKLGDRAAFRFEAEYGERRRSWGDQPVTDNVSAWDGTPYAGTGSTAVPAGHGMAAIPTGSDYLVYLPDHPEAGVKNLRGFARSTGNSTLALVPDGRPYVPNSDQMPRRDFDLQPPNNLTVGKYYFTTAYLEKRFTDNFFVQFAANRRYRDYSREGAVWVSDLRRDPNQLLPGGATNPNFGKLYVDGDPFVQRQWADPRDFRLLLNYRFETSWTQQNFSLLASYARNQFRLTNTRLIRSNNRAVSSLINTGNVIHQRYYVDEDSAPWAFSSGSFAGTGIDVIPYRASASTTSSNTLSYQISEVGSYFKERLNTIFGLRRDSLDRFSIASTINNANAQLTSTRSNLPDLTITTPSAGVVYYPVPQVGAFFNYSGSFSPIGSVNPLIDTGLSPESPTGHSKEYGLYFKFLQERINGSLRRYDSVQEGRIVTAPGVTQINNIWGQLGAPLEQLPTALSDTQNLNSTGYELEIIANLTPSWRTSLNFALPKSQQASSYPNTLAYRARHLAQWQAAAATDPIVRDNLTNLQTAIDGGFDGREQNTALKYTANIYTSYDFRRGPLKGFGLGGGANLFGDQIIGNRVGAPFDYLYNGGYVSFSGHLNYKGKLRGKSYRIQLNVTNVFDNDKLIFGTVGTYQGVNYPNTFRFLEARRIALTTTFDF